MGKNNSQVGQSPKGGWKRGEWKKKKEKKDFLLRVWKEKEEREKKKSKRGGWYNESE
jgi:hypothetical protein